MSIKYFIDTEFIEDGRIIELISIGIVAEDGREYYAQSVEFDPAYASGWVREHVLTHLKTCSSTGKWNMDKSLYSWCRCDKPDCPWRQRNEIADEIRAFLDIEKYGEPELWGYYSAYDHVAFCQLFGTMMDLPEGYPMYTRDLKQWCDTLGNPRLPDQGESEHYALADARWNRQAWQFLHAHEGNKNT
jgi:hypothetical protein